MEFKRNKRISLCNTSTFVTTPLLIYYFVAVGLKVGKVVSSCKKMSILN